MTRRSNRNPDDNTTRANVAAIVVNHNGGELLARCLSALAEQDLAPKKIIVVDNASTDGSVDRLPARYAGTELIRLRQNPGFAAANNIAVAEAEDCDWIALINPDAFVEPDWLRKLLASAQKHPEYAFFASRMLNERDPSRLDGAGDVYHVSGAHWRRGHAGREQGRCVAIEEVFSPCAAAALYRRDALVEAGGFDESFFCYAEDIDLGFRMRLRGYKCLYVPDAVVRHVGSATTGPGSDFTVYHGHRNLVWAYVKNMPGMLFWLYLPQHLLLNLISVIWFMARGRAKVILKAKWDAVSGLPRVLRERRRVRKSRRIGAREIRRAMEKSWFAPYKQYFRRRA